MSDRSLYRYLGEDLQIDQFQQLAETVQRALGHTSHAQDIGNQLTKIRNKHEIWPSKIMATYHKYRLPDLTQQDISVLNQEHETRIVEINNLRETSRKELRSQIDRRQKLCDDAWTLINKKYASCTEKINLIDSTLDETRRHPSPNYTAESIRHMYAERQAYVQTYADERRRLLRIHQEHQEKIDELRNDLKPIKDLTKSNNQKYWFLGRGIHMEGWNPIINDYEPIQHDKVLKFG